MRWFLILGIALALAAPARAQWVSIDGIVDCGQWIEARTEKAADNLENYLLGLINGLTIGYGSEFWRAGSPLSRQAVYLWMDGYCRDDPLSNIVTGAINLYQRHSGWEPPP